MKILAEAEVKRLAFEEGKKNTGNDADLADPEDKHPFDKRGLDRRQTPFKLFLHEGRDILACTVIDLAKKIYKGVCAVVSKLFS
ncbi:MAG: hypothetical protein HYW03_04950 [Deltaproteobacteria bacterium]|nr:hypothetical protein [Deltaproteobacteria bacterium]MBI2531551.1 hypothetical protein [Deltaproteobacteria bacterium]